jgi:hypothetical protein
VLGLVEEVDMSSGLRLRPSSSLSSWMERVLLHGADVDQMRTCQRLGVTAEELARGEEDEGERGRVLGP